MAVVREIWDDYWKKMVLLDTERTIENDLYYRLLKRLIDLPRDRNLSILEVGCGSGIRTLALLKEFQLYALNATLVDFSSIALAFAKKNAGENFIDANFVLADALRLPFSDESFDIIWNEGVNEHFNGEKRQHIFNEMARVCKGGGQVVVMVPNAWSLPYRLWKKVLEGQGRWQYGFEKAFSIIELKNKIEKAGLTPLKTGGTGILSTIQQLAEIISRKSKSEDNVDSKKSAASGILRKTYHRVEKVSEKVGWFAGGNIGVKAIK